MSSRCSTGVVWRVLTLNPQAIEQLKSVKYDIPCVIGGNEFRTAQKKEHLCVSVLFPGVCALSSL